MEITKSAVAEFKKIIKENGGKDSGIRIFISGGGCCGTSFGLEVTEKGEPGEKAITKDGIKVFLSKEAEEILLNATIDSSSEGFKISGLPASGSSCCS